MKKFMSVYVFLLFVLSSPVFAADEVAAESAGNVAEAQEEITNDAIQIIEMEENKVILNIQKQPLNEQSKQKLLLKKNWFVVNVNINGKVKVQPITGTYEVE